LAVAKDVAVAVEDVVDDLEQHPELVRKVAPRLLVGVRQLGDPERAGDRCVEEAAGLQAVDLLERVAELLRVCVLAADHPERRLDELPRDERRRIGQRQSDRLGKERIPGENRGRLVVLRPRARPPASELVVVERGQVVVDEREVVDELDRGTGRQELLGLAAQCLAGRETEDRPDPLAAAGERIADRRGELAELGSQCELVEIALDHGGQLTRARHPASFFALVSSASTSFAISASSERISIARSGSCVDSSSCRVRSRRSSSTSARCRLSSALIYIFSKRSTPRCFHRPGSTAVPRLSARPLTRHPQAMPQATSCSRAIRPRIPFTSRPASSVAYRLARVTASSIATSSGTLPSSSS